MSQAAVLLLAAGGALLLLATTQASAQDGDGNQPDNPDGNDYGLGFASGLLDDAVGAMTMDQQNTGALSAQGLATLEGLEGFSPTPYPDHKGYSIGYGHLIQPGESLSSVTQEQAASLLAQDVATAENTVNGAVSVALNQSQFDALVSFVYNVGGGAFRSSTLLRKLNAGDYQGAAAEFPRWVNASGQVNQSLVARRNTEQALFEA